MEGEALDWTGRRRSVLLINWNREIERHNRQTPPSETGSPPAPHPPTLPPSHFHYYIGMLSSSNLGTKT